MADGLELNAGSGGATLATDDAGVAGHVQVVKLAIATDGSATAIPADATDGMLVNLGANNDVSVTGTVTVDGSGVTQPVSDAGGSLTVDNAALSVTGGGVEASALRVTLASDSTGVLSVDDNGGSLTVDGTVTANLSATDNAVLDTIASTVNAAATVYQNIRVTDGSSFVTPGTEYSEDAATPATITGPAIMMERDDALSTLAPIEGDWAALRCDANGALWTTINGTVTVGSHNVTNAGTFAVQATLQASTNTTEVVGDAAHDAAVAGNPVRIAGRAVTSDYTSVATGDTADLITTVGGKLVVHPYAIPENYVKGATSDITDTTSTSVVAAAAAGIKNYITQITVQNSHATVGTWVNIQDGSGGSTLYTVYAAAAGGGAAITLPCPISTTAATALYCACATTGANVRVSASGYKAP